MCARKRSEPLQGGTRGGFRISLVLLSAAAGLHGAPPVAGRTTAASLGHSAIHHHTRTRPPLPTGTRLERGNHPRDCRIEIGLAVEVRLPESLEQLQITGPAARIKPFAD